MTLALALTAAAAMALVIFRAWTQAITIDEATTYLLFVQSDQPFHWAGSSNNHVVNTALMRLTTRLFGVSEISARLPALVGAAIYITACYRFCRRLEGGALLRWAALVCFVFSPFILDYLVAARGYSLALGFLMTALLADVKTSSGAVLASTAIGLCFGSNFSFAFVCAAVWIARFPGRALIVAYTLPVVLTVWIVSAPSLLDFPSAELTYGAHSLIETFTSIFESQGKYALYAALPLAGVAMVGKRVNLYTGLAVGTVALHFAAFHAFGLLYPLDRTGIFFVPLAVAAIAATPAVGWSQNVVIGSLLLIAASNLALLRLDRFEEWHFDADTDEIYSVLSCAHERHGVKRIASGWPYTAALNFYRAAAGPDSFDTVANEPESSPDTEVFVIDSRLNPNVMAERRLTALWKSKVTEAVIAAPEEQLGRLRGSSCF